MSARAVVLGVILAVSLASCTVAQEAPQGLTERQAEVAAVVESLAKALMAGDLEAIKQGVQFPLLAVAVMGAEPPRIEEITEELLTPDATSAALARYGMAKQVQLVQPSVALPAFNVAVYASEIQWQNEAGDALVRDRMAGLFSKRGGAWRLCAVIMGPEQGLQPDEAAQQQIGAAINGMAKAIVHGDEDAYMAAFRPPIIDIDPDFGARRLGYNELQAQFRQLTYMLSDAGVADVTVSTAPAFMIGPDAACVIGMAQGIDAAGAPIGYRAQAALLVKDAGTWKIVAQAAGMAEEGTAPQGAFGVPSAP